MHSKTGANATLGSNWKRSSAQRQCHHYEEEFYSPFGGSGLGIGLWELKQKYVSLRTIAMMKPNQLAHKFDLCRPITQRIFRKGSRYPDQSIKQRPIAATLISIPLMMMRSLLCTIWFCMRVQLACMICQGGPTWKSDGVSNAWNVGGTSCQTSKGSSRLAKTNNTVVVVKIASIKRPRKTKIGSNLWPQIAFHAGFPFNKINWRSLKLLLR